jgi:probable selenium-dependent hydroxylase accessory protein YqeC
MSELADWMGIAGGSRSNTAVVGAGGKTTTTFGLGAELAAFGDRTIVTTTTKMGRDQTGGLTVVGVEQSEIVRALDTYGTCLVVDQLRTSDRKISGLTGEQVDTLFNTDPHIVNHIVAEADGARKHTVKAPAPHEPVIASTVTHVLALIGGDALNRVIEDQAHRPMRVAAAAGLNPYDRLTPFGASRLLTDAERGSRKSVPESAWYGVIINRVTDAQKGAAQELHGLLVKRGVPCLIRPFISQ